ncbi:TPA: hypothetical protein ACH3X1_001657 [Trebouxia sp. C0004]
MSGRQDSWHGLSDQLTEIYVITNLVNRKQYLTLDTVPTAEQDYWESWYIKLHNTYEGPGYNLTAGGQARLVNPSEQTRQLQSDRQRKYDSGLLMYVREVRHISGQTGPGLYIVYKVSRPGQTAEVVFYKSFQHGTFEQQLKAAKTCLYEQIQNGVIKPSKAASRKLGLQVPPEGNDDEQAALANMSTTLQDQHLGEAEENRGVLLAAPSAPPFAQALQDNNGKGIKRFLTV